jgi:DNA invertase Pin-like site-specific DNA recombinase
MANDAVRMAELELDVQERRRKTSKDSAAKRPSPKTQKVRDEIRRLVENGKDPRTYVSKMARRFGCSSTLVYRVLNGEKKTN